MATVDSNFDQNQAYLLTGETPPAGQPAGQPAPTTQEQVAEAQPPPQKKEPQVPKQPQFQTYGSLYDRLFSPLDTGLEGGRTALGDAAELFRSEAGPSRSFESVGGAETIQKAVETGDAGATQKAKGYVGASYQGPQGINTNTMAGLQGLYQQMKARHGALTSGGGLQTMLRGSAPGLSMGEGRFEAQRLLRDDAYRARARAPGRGIRSFGGSIRREGRSAQDYAQQRAGEERSLADAATSALSGRKGAINTDLQASIEAAKQQQAEVEAAYAKAVQSGDINAIREISPYLQSGTAQNPGDMAGAGLAEMFNTQGMQDKASADAAWKQIMEDPRYASVSGYDPLQRMLTKRGSEGYQLAGDRKAGDWLDPTDAPGLTGEKVRMLRERQKSLETEFGRGGKSAGVKPLYDYGVGDYEGGRPSQYLDLDLGTRPSRENISSDEQRTQFNRITDMLGEVEKIADAGDPYRAAQIFGDIDTYLADEESYMEGRKETLTKREKEWKNLVRKSRKKYRKAKRNAKMASVIAIASFSGIGIPSDIALADAKWKRDDYKDAMKSITAAGADARGRQQPVGAR